MKLLWTKSQNPVDWLIKLASGEDCAHMAILFESRAGTGVVFESNLIGCHPAFYKTWLGSTRRIIHEITINTTTEQEDAIWDRWVELFDGHQYDFGGAIYLGLMKLRKRIFGTPLPETNRWASRATYFCDEIYQLISGLPGCPPIPFKTNGMSTPHDVWLAFLKAKQNG